MSILDTKTSIKDTNNRTTVEPLRSAECSTGPCKTSPKPREVVPFHARRPKPKKDSMLSCRYELKYRIRESKAQAIARYIRAYLPIDKFSKGKSNLEYPISSLYLDSDRLHLCRETLEGKTNRYKLRIRCYDDNPQSPCFFEIKRRLNSVILKDRARMSKDGIGRMLRYGYVPDDFDQKDQKALRQFMLYVNSLQAHPVVMVRYKRQAFEGSGSNRVRVTFDRKLSYKSTTCPIVTTDGSGWHEVPMDFVVLEIKFTSQYPLWLSEMVKIFDLKQTSMSKYCSSVRTSRSMGFSDPTCELE